MYTTQNLHKSQQLLLLTTWLEWSHRVMFLECFDACQVPAHY